VHDLAIELREFAFAPSLAEPLSAEEQALLKVSEWVARWQASQTPEDLVLAATYGDIPRGEDWPAQTDTWVEKLNMRMVVAPGRGTILSVQAAAANERPVVDWIAASLPEGLLVGAPLRNAKLALPLGDKQLKITAETKGNDQPASPVGRPFALSFGVSWESAPADASPIEVNLKLQPATLLALLQDERIKCSIEGGLLQIERPGFRAKIEAATGKPLEIAWTDPASGWTLSIAAAKDALSSERKRIDERLAGARSAFDAEAPWHSAARYALDEAAFVLAALDRAGAGDPDWQRQEAGYRALLKLLAAWQPPELRGLAGIAPGDDVETHSFSLPRQLTNLDFDGLIAGDATARRNMTGYALGLLRRATPQDGWLWPVSRDLVLMYGERWRHPGVDLPHLVGVADTGPVGAMFLSWLGTDTAASNGLARLNLEGFRRDYRALLAGDCWLSKLILSLAEAARTLDESELRDLAELIEHDTGRKRLTTILASLKTHSDHPVAESLARALDEVWTAGFRDYVRDVLEFQNAAEHQPLAVAPRAEEPTPLSDQLKGLEALEAELKSAQEKRRE
jgi:hypothetical protein